MSPHTIAKTMFGASEAREQHEPAVGGPQVLLKGVTTPAAMPWDQGKAAEMEARLQSPLPGDVVAWRLQRLQAWRPGAPGRFLAAYVRRSDIGNGLSTTEPFEGQSYRFEFYPPGRREAEARRLLLIAAAAGLITLTLIVAAVAAIRARIETSVQLTGLESAVARRSRQLSGQMNLEKRDQILVGAGMANQSPSRALSDLAWVAQNHVEQANIEAILWEPGLTAVEIRGNVAPFESAERGIRRSDRPVRPGVSLWGVVDGVVASPSRAP